MRKTSLISTYVSTIRLASALILAFALDCAIMQVSAVSNGECSLATVLFPPEGLSIEEIGRTCARELGFDPLRRLPPALLDDLDLRVPFLIGKHEAPIELVNRYLRQRAQAKLVWISQRELADKTLKDYANEINILLKHFDEPSVEKLRFGVNTFLKKYKYDLRKSKLSASTINKRYFIAEALLKYIAAESGESLQRDATLDEVFRRSMTNFSGQRINIQKPPGKQARRRNPNQLSILAPQELLNFFASFKDRSLAASAKIIYATGARRAEVAGITAGQLLKLKQTSPSAAAKLKVVGKGNKERVLEVEPALLAGLRSYVGSDHRLKRARLWARHNGSNPFSDDAPLLLNRFGDALSGPAIADAFLRASRRCEIFRSPHELRHEFAVSYLLDKYRSISARIERANFDAWIARLMVDRVSLVVLRLSQLLGHSNAETTKRYLGMLIGTDMGIRDSWCEHLESLGAGLEI